MNTFEDKVAIISLSFYKSECKSFFQSSSLKSRFLLTEELYSFLFFYCHKSTCSLYFTQTCVKGVVLREHETMSIKKN